MIPYMNIYEKRLTILKALIGENQLKDFAGAHADVDASYISQILNGHRTLGDRAATNLAKSSQFLLICLRREPTPPKTSIKSPPRGSLLASSLQFCPTQHSSMQPSTKPPLEQRKSGKQASTGALHQYP